MSDKNPRELPDFHFRLTKEAFIKDFLPVYERLGVKPRFLIQFPIVLPFQIPFNEGTCTTFQLSNDDACTLIFSDVIMSDNFEAGILSEEVQKFQTCKSRVEMTYVSSSNEITTDEETINNIYDQLMYTLNSIILSYLISKKDVDVYQVTKEMLRFCTIYRVVPVEDWEKAYEGLFLTHLGVDYEREKLTPEENDQILWYSHVIEEGLNPFIISEIVILNAKRYFKSGFYKEAVLYAQTSVETFLNTLFLKLLELEGLSTTEIEKIFEETSFMGMVKKELPPRVGGSWDPYNESSIVGKWYKDTYLLRNKVTHAGYYPSFSETDDAVFCAVELRQYVVENILKKKKKYPDIAQFFVTKK